MIFNNTLCENTSETRTAYQKNVRENEPPMYFFHEHTEMQAICLLSHSFGVLIKKEKEKTTTEIQNKKEINCNSRPHAPNFHLP